MCVALYMYVPCLCTSRPHVTSSVHISPLCVFPLDVCIHRSSVYTSLRVYVLLCVQYNALPCLLPSVCISPPCVSLSVYITPPCSPLFVYISPLCEPLCLGISFPSITSHFHIFLFSMYNSLLCVTPLSLPFLISISVCLPLHLNTFMCI